MKSTHALPLLRRLSAFTDDSSGGNPAGVWIGASLPETAEMQRIAAGIGDSETAFLVPLGGRSFTVRYFSPEAEVPFCGHATIATGVLLGELEGEAVYLLETSVGQVPVRVARTSRGFEASLTSVATKQRPASEELLASVLSVLGWKREELDRAIPPAVAFAGAWHLVLAVSSGATLDRLAYDFDRLKEIMLAEDLTTLQLIRREREDLFHSRNPFPVGGIVEDPATGAAAAALGGYLRDARLAPVPFDFTIRQGEAMGRPSLIRVHVPVEGGVTVTGAAVPIDAA
jgi:PhzF family phenazine biosynthesis protein